MASLLVATKFAPPRIGGRSVVREHLMDRLQDTRQCKLVLITGSAGFGKTTLVAQWRQELIKSGATVAWLSLSAEDAPPAQFCDHVIGALQQAGVALEDDLLLLSETGTSAGVQAISSALINSLARTPSELYLVMDDFHHVNDPRTLQFVQKLVDAAPASLHVVIASRTPPALRLGRLRASGELVEVGFAELSFDFRESLDFLKTHLDAGIDLDAAHRIHELTDGWPIGLQLMAISLKANPGNRARLSSLHPSIEDLSAYLTEDVIVDLPADLLEFMQKVSILRRFTPEVASHVTGFPQAAELIASIEARNLFILPVDVHGQEPWYRFHPMFAEFLNARLTRTAIDASPLHHRAAQWFANKGLLVEAVRHALLCEDFEAVIQLLESALSPLTSVSHLSAFMRWISRVPQHLRTQHPNLLVLAGWACALTARPTEAEAWIAELESAHAAPRFRREIHLLKVLIGMQRDDWPHIVENLKSLGDAPLEHRALEQMRIALNIGALAFQGQHAAARSMLNSAAARDARTGTDEMALVVRVTAATAALRQGNVLEAERIGAAALADAEAIHGRRSVSASSAGAVMASVFYELDRIDDARETLANRLDMLRFSTPEGMFNAALCYARLQLLQEGARDALDFLLEEEARCRSLGIWRGVAHMLAEQLRVVIGTGDWRHGETLQLALDDIARQHPEEHPRDFEIRAMAAVSRARLALATQAPERALEALNDVSQFATTFGRGILDVISDLLRAQALDALGRREASRQCLRVAVGAAYRLGLVRTLLDEGPKLRALLAGLDYSAGDALGAYVARLTMGEQTAAPGARAGSPADLAPTITEDASALTKRELEILSLLERSMSNKRIALALNISIQTVKWNLKKIFVKLGVSSRYDAIVVARRLPRGNADDPAQRRV